MQDAVVEQARGILIERYGLTPHRALQRLIRVSQESRRPLVEVATDVIAARSGGLPRDPGPGPSGEVHVDPRLPDCWPEITVRLRVRDALVHLRVRNDRVGVWSSTPLRLNAGGRRVERMPATPPGA